MSKRFAMYFMGVAIGLVLLGLFQVMRSGAQRAANAPPGPVSAPGPVSDPAP